MTTAVVDQVGFLPVDTNDKVKRQWLEIMHWGQCRAVPMIGRMGR
jgi:hypothetical protein